MDKLISDGVPYVSLHASTLRDLFLLLQWLGWSASPVLPVRCLGDPVEAFASGRLRVLAAFDGRTPVPVGLSVVASPEYSGEGRWAVHEGQAVPESECLLWVALVTDPARRGQGFGRALMTRTLQLAVTGSYPYVLACLESDNGSGPLLKRGFRPTLNESPGECPAMIDGMFYIRQTVCDLSVAPFRQLPTGAS